MADEQLDQLGFVHERPDLESALEQVRANPEAAKKFASDPQGYLESKGVSTEGLDVSASTELSDSDLEQVAGGAAGVCGGVGAGVCGSVGGDIEAT